MSYYSETEIDSAKMLELLSEILKSQVISSDIPQNLASNSNFMELYDSLLELREFSLALAVGDLSRNLRRKGYLAGALKTLHSSLRHLTWQTGVIASGDFSQRVDFMGEFSESFNFMVKQLDEAMQLLEKTSRTDPLTGINNRGYFMQMLAAELARSERYKHNLSLIMMDLDHFKSINDTFGHAAGDVALKASVEALKSCCLRSSDFFGRIGGEEFAVVLPETKLEHAMVAAERMRSMLSKTPVCYDGTVFVVTASLGVSRCLPTDSLETLLGRADKAMYQAKKDGRNCVRSA